VETGYSVFDTTPTSFVVTSQLDTYEFHQFVARYMELQKGDGHSLKERTPQKHCKENYWLVKPANMNQGRGIEIFNSLTEIQKFLSSKEIYSYWVIQKYIERPLLFKGRKFDIRMWAFASHKQEFYMYKKGYLRTSSDDYSLSNENNYVHLTNNCLQKYGDNYGKHEDGNTVGFEVF
jgi:Tubulin-tyrosine ligase family